MENVNDKKIEENLDSEENIESQKVVENEAKAKEIASYRLNKSIRYCACSSF